MSELPFPLWSQEENTIPHGLQKGVQFNTHTLPPIHPQQKNTLCSEAE